MIQWTCPWCKKTRPDNAISVAKHDYSAELGFEKGTFVMNVKYCNDNGDCASKAFDRELNMPANLKEKSKIKKAS